MNLWKIILTLICCLFCISRAHAVVKVFDDDRRGAFAELCFGGGFTTISSENYGMTGTITKATAVMTFKFGYAPTRQFQLLLFQKSSVYANKLWEHYDDWADEFKKSKAIGYIAVAPLLPVIAFFTDQHLLLGIGAAYYLRPRTQTWFIEGGIGPSLLDDPYELDHTSSFPAGVHSGYGLFAGVGYEFTRHGQVELQIMGSRASWERDGITMRWEALSVMLTVGIIGY